MATHEAIMASVNGFCAGVSVCCVLATDGGRRLVSTFFLIVNVIAVVLWLT